MTALLLHLRAEARRQWPAWVAVVLLIGTVGGMVLGSLAGARRTASAYDRMVADTEAWDVLVNPNDGIESALDPEAVGRLPQVEEIGTLDGVGATVMAGDETTLGAGPLVLAARDERVLVEFSRPRVVDGAIYDPADPSHVMIEDVVAETYGVQAGDTLQIGTATVEELIEWEEAGASGPMPLTPRDATVAAVVTMHDGIVVDEGFQYGHVFLSPAFAEAHELTPFFFGMAVRLQEGADMRELRAAVQRLAPGEAIEFKTEAAVADTVRRGTMPHTAALLLFAVVVGAAGVVVAGQAASRQLDGLRREAPNLLAMGLDRRQLRRAALLRAGGLGAAGTGVALVVAVAVSPLFPLGVADRAEIEPGVDVDGLVLAPGGLLLFTVLVGWCAVTMRKVGRPARPAPLRRPRWAERIATAFSSPIATMGLRASLAPGGDARATPVRAALGGLSLAVAAVAATVTFGANLDDLVETPSEYGWGWDAMLALPSEDWETPPAVFEDRAASQPELSGWSLLTVDQISLDDERVPAIGIEYREGDVGPTILAGRRPESDGEVVLGGRTMDELGVGIGDEVVAGTGEAARPLEVVGQAVFAGLGTYPGADRTELGKGALFTRDALDSLGEGFGFLNLLLSTDGDAELQAALEGIIGDQESALEAEEIELFAEPARPADVQSLSKVRSTPVVLALVLAGLGGAAFAFVLVSGVRNRRREIALLKTFGFQGRDVASTVAWQATATAVVAGAVGITVGSVAGRMAWRVLADVLGVSRDAHLPATLLLVLAGIVLLANLLAVAPGVLAARTRPAAMLRTE